LLFDWAATWRVDEEEERSDGGVLFFLNADGGLKGGKPVFLLIFLKLYVQVEMSGDGDN
jgi:hypothetical protein